MAVVALVVMRAEDFSDGVAGDAETLGQPVDAPSLVSHDDELLRERFATADEHGLSLHEFTTNVFFRSFTACPAQTTAFSISSESVSTSSDEAARTPSETDRQTRCMDKSFARRSECAGGFSKRFQGLARITPYSPLGRESKWDINFAASRVDRWCLMMASVAS